MMGSRQVEQAALFYEFSLERHIPTDWCQSHPQVSVMNALQSMIGPQ